MIHGIIPDPVNSRMVLDIMLKCEIDESKAYEIYKQLKKIEKYEQTRQRRHYQMRKNSN